MPPKKIGRGLKKGEGKGRTKSADGSSDEDPEKTREYFRNKRAEYRQQQSTPKKRAERYPGVGESSAQRSLRSPSAGTSRGRPGRPPESASGPQTPGTRRKLNTQLQREKRHTIAVSRSRSRASLRRWHKGASGDTSTSTSAPVNGPRRCAVVNHFWLPISTAMLDPCLRAAAMFSPQQVSSRAAEQHR